MKLFIALSIALIFIISHCQVEIIEDDASKFIANLGQCKWNQNAKMCEDPTKKCTGRYCCKTTGKTLNGVPQCRCSDTLLEGSCDPCVYTGIGTECKDSTSGKCSGKSCCQASFFPGAKQFQCKCQDCPFIDTCRWNKEFKKCQDPKGVCVGEKCCKLTGKYLANGIPQCTCTGSYKEGTCDTCIWTGTKDFCKDPKQKCIGDLCCKAKYFPDGKDFTCGCSVCNPPTCRWSPKEKKCNDPTGTCKGDRCCKPSGKLLDDGIPECLCEMIPTGQPYCDNCVWSGKGSICKDPSGKCSADRCCQPKFFAGSNEFACNCEDCPVVSDRCLWDANLKKCNDPTLQCVGKKCCRPSGKVMVDGTPHCACTGSALLGDCDGCQWSKKSQQCYNTDNLCSGKKCCLPNKITGLSDFECKCQTCSQIPPKDTCKWNDKMKKCQDPLKQCVGQKCCLPTGKILDIGVPQCACKGSATLGQCDNCQWTGQGDICKDSTKKCNSADVCCLAKYIDVKNFVCQCNKCQVQAPTCKWNKLESTCKDTIGLCAAKKNCCIQSKSLDADGNPGCLCEACVQFA